MTNKPITSKRRLQKMAKKMREQGISLPLAFSPFQLQIIGYENGGVRVQSAGTRSKELDKLSAKIEKNVRSYIEALGAVQR